MYSKTKAMELRALSGEIHGTECGWAKLGGSVSLQQRASKQIDGYLVVVLSVRSEPGQIGTLFVFAGGIKATETDHQIAQSGEILRSMAFTGGRTVLAESDIADVMERVFDGPVVPAEGLDLSGVHLSGRATGDDDFDFFGNLQRLEMMSGAGQDRRLDGVRESRSFRSDFEGVDLTGFMPTMALAQSDVGRKKKGRFRPWQDRRVFPRAWVDWL